MKKNNIIILTSMLFLAEEINAVEEKIETNPFDGVYKRIGTIQYVKGVPVDTVYISKILKKKKNLDK